MPRLDEVSQQFRWEVERIATGLRRHRRETHVTPARVARERRTPFPTAAFILAIGRVGEATARCGI